VRNTDNAWISTKAYHYHDSANLFNYIHDLKKSDAVSDFSWVVAHEDIDLWAEHKFLLMEAIRKKFGSSVELFPADMSQFREFEDDDLFMGHDLAQEQEAPPADARAVGAHDAVNANPAGAAPAERPAAAGQVGGSEA
jgi:hypothetical protein